MSITALRTRSTLAILAAATLAAACGAAPPPVPPTPATQPLAIWDAAYGWVDQPVAAAAAPPERWRAALPPDAPWDLDPTGTVLVTAAPGGNGTRVERLDVATGAPVWGADLPPGDPTVEVLGVPPVAVLVAYPGVRRSVVLDPGTGVVLVDTTADDGGVTVSATPDVLLLGTLDDTTAHDLTGGELWTTPLQVTVVDGELLAVDTATAGAGTVSVLDPATGRPRWTAPRPGFSDTTAVGGRVISSTSAEITAELAGVLGFDPPVPSGSGDTAYALDAATGTPDWVTPGLPSLGAGRVLALGDDALLLTPGDSGAPSVALDAATGAVRWTAPDAPTVPVRVDGTAHVLDLSVRPVVHAAADGRELARVPDDVPFGAAWGFAGSVLLAVTDDDVVAYGVPDLREGWRVATGPVSGVAPLPGGVLVRTAAGLVAYAE